MAKTQVKHYVREQLGKDALNAFPGWRALNFPEKRNNKFP